MLETRFESPGFYCLDEPEAALSFQSTLGLLEAGPWGLRETTWSNLDLVGHWRRFLDAPERYLRHLTD